MSLWVLTELNMNSGARDMVQKIKVFVAEANDPSFIPVVHMVKEKKPDSSGTCDTHTQINIRKFFF